MTKLDCSVKNCVHNSDNCCCKEAIVVDGCKAKECCETCCGSFSENDGGMFKNLFKTPEKSLKIDCEAVNCSIMKTTDARRVMWGLPEMVHRKRNRRSARPLR